MGKYNGEFYTVYFGKTNSPEINDTHFSFVYSLPKGTDLALVIPTISPKRKYFNDDESFENRDAKKLKSKLHYYLKETDSLVLIAQIKSISDSRIKAKKLDENNEVIYLPQVDLNNIRQMYLKLIKNVIS